MVLQIAPAEEREIAELMTVQFSAFEGEPYHEVLYPGGNTPSARAAAGERVLKEWRRESHQYIVKCTDLERGVLIGFATWEFYEQQRPEEEWKKEEKIDWCDGRTKELAEIFLGATYSMRQKIWQGRPHCCEFIQHFSPINQI